MRRFFQLFQSQRMKQGPPLKGRQKGMALVLAMFTIVLVSYIATEIAYETSVEYLVNSTAVSKIKAHYAAQAGIEISLLRIKIYQQITSKMSKAAKEAMKLNILNLIWQMPLAWPPVVPDGLDEIGKENINSVLKESLVDASYTATITDEGTKIDINSLWGPTKGLRDATREQILQIFENKIASDEKWAKEHQSLKPSEIVDNLQDWVTPSNMGSRGDKTSYFSSLGEGYPPHRGFRTVGEVRLVPGVTEDIYNLLKDHLTVYGMKGINPNTASRDILMALDVSMTKKVVDEIVARRENPALGGPFRSPKEFWGYALSQGAQVTEERQKLIPIVTDSVYNFRIKAVGSYNRVSSLIEVVVFDLGKTSQQGYLLLGRQANLSSTEERSNQRDSNSNNSSSKGAPRIVYWNER